MNYLLPKEGTIIQFYLERYPLRIYKICKLFLQQKTSPKKNKKIKKILREELHLLKMIILAFVKQQLLIFSSKKYSLDAPTLSLLLIKYLDLDIITLLTKNNSWESDANYKAARYYLEDYLLKKQEIWHTNNINRIEGYLQAFESLCEIQDWERANKIINLFLDTKTSLSLKRLYNILINWGYEQRASILYPKLWQYSDINDKDGYFIELGSLFITLFKYEEGINCYKKSLEIVQKKRNKTTSEAQCLNLLGQTYTIIGEYQSAIEYHKKALDILLKNRNKLEFWNRFWEKYSLFRSIFLLLNLAVMFVILTLGNPVLVQIFVPILILLNLSIPESIGVSQNTLADTLNQLGNAYSKMKEYQTAIKFYQEALEEDSSNKKNSRELIHSLCNIGDVYLLVGDHQNSIIYYEEALQVAQNRILYDKSIKEGNVLYKLGSVYLIMKDYQKAEEKYIEALLCFKKIEYKSGEALTLNCLGNLCLNLGEYQKAIKYYEQARSIYKETNNYSDESVVIENLNLASQYLESM